MDETKKNFFVEFKLNEGRARTARFDDEFETKMAVEVLYNFFDAEEFIYLQTRTVYCPI